MWRGVKLLVLQIVFTTGLAAQSGGGFVPNTFENSVEVFDPNGRTFVNTSVDVAGSPFFSNDWRPGLILMNNDKAFRNTRLRLNLQDQEVHYLAPGNVEMSIPAGTVKEIVFFSDTSRNSQVLADFQSGFPAIDEQNVNNFYQVLSRGTILLLLSLQKTIAEEKDEFSGEIRRHFADHSNYYVYAGSNLVRVRMDRSFVQDLLADKKDQVTAFIKAYNFKFRSADDLKKVIDYYNTLP